METESGVPEEARKFIAEPAESIEPKPEQESGHEGGVEKVNILDGLSEYAERKLAEKLVSAVGHNKERLLAAASELAATPAQSGEYDERFRAQVDSLVQATRSTLQSIVDSDFDFLIAFSFSEKKIPDVLVALEPQIAEVITALLQGQVDHQRSKA